MSTSVEKMNYSSALERRFLCPGSAAIEAKYPYDDTQSPAAAEGTMLHECTCNVLKGLPMQPEELDPLTEDQIRDVQWCVDEMQEYADDPENTMITEYKLDLTEQDRLNKPRLDVGFINPSGKITIFELKFGFMYVKHPRWNWQCKDYACGAWLTFGGSEVEVVVLQPRALSEDQWRRGYTFCTEELQALDVEIRGVVEKACSPDAPIVPGNDQCYYCRAKEECPARKSVIETIPRHLTVKDSLESMEPIDRYRLLEKVISAQGWLKDYKKAIDGYMLDGGEVPGWTLGESKKKSKWRDDFETIAALREKAIEKGKDPDKLLQPQKPLGLTDTKKILGGGVAMKSLYNSLRETPAGEVMPVRVKGFIDAGN